MSCRARRCRPIVVVQKRPHSCVAKFGERYSIRTLLICELKPILLNLPKNRGLNALIFLGEKTVG